MPGTLYITIDKLPWLNKDRKDTSISMNVEDCRELHGTIPDNDEQLIRKGPHESDYYN